MRGSFGGPTVLILCGLASGVGQAAGVRAPCCDGFGRFGVAPTDGVLVGAFSPDGEFSRSFHSSLCLCVSVVSLLLAWVAVTSMEPGLARGLTALPPNSTL